MTIRRGHLVSTGAALRRAEQQGLPRDEIAKVEIDGIPVDAGAARDALADAEQAAAAAAARKAVAEARAEARPSLWQRVQKTVGAGVSSATAVVKRTVAEPTVQFLEQTAPVVNRAGAQVGELTREVVTSDPEDVLRKGRVVLTLKNGGTVAIPVLVADDTTAAILKGTSILAGGASMVPFFGNLVQGGTGLVCALASGASYMVGDDDLARSLGGMAKKHVTLGVAGFIPGLGVVSTVAAARDVARFQQGVPIDQLVEDARPSPPPQPPDEAR